MNRKNFAIGTLVLLVFVVFGGFIGTFGQEVVPGPGSDTPPNLTTKTILQLRPKSFSAIQKIRLSYLVGLGDSVSVDPSSRFKLSKLGVSKDHQILTVVKCTNVGDCDDQLPKNTSKDMVSSVFGGIGNSVSSQREGSTIVGGDNNTLSGASANSFIGGSRNTQLRGDNSVILGSANSSLIGNQSTIIGGMSNNTIQGNNVSILGGQNVSVQANNSFAIGKNITITHDGVFAFNVRSEPLISQRAHTFLIMANRGLVINSDKPNSSSSIGLTVNGNIKVGYEAQSANKQGALVRKTCTITNILLVGKLEHSCLCSYGSGNNKTTPSTSSTMCQLLCNSNKADGSPCPMVNGKCDPKRSRVFPSSATDWPVDSFYCSAGNQNHSVKFPDPGEVIEWRCIGFGPNAVPENCTVKRMESTHGFCNEVTLIAGATNINNLLGSDFCESGDFINLVLTGGSHGDYIAKRTCAGMSSIPSGGGPLPNPIPNGTISSHCVAICPTGTYFQGGVCQVPNTTVIDGQCAAVTLAKGSPNLMTLKNHNFLCASGYAEGGPWNNGEGTAHWICKGKNGGLDAFCSAECPHGTVLRGNICTDGSSPTNCKEIELKEGTPNLEKMSHLDFCMTGSPTETDWGDGKTIATWKCGAQSCASSECPDGTALSGGVCRSPTTPEDPPFCIPAGNTCVSTSECCQSPEALECKTLETGECKGNNYSYYYWEPYNSDYLLGMQFITDFETSHFCLFEDELKDNVFVYHNGVQVDPKERFPPEPTRSPEPPTSNFFTTVSRRTSAPCYINGNPGAPFTMPGTESFDVGWTSEYASYPCNSFLSEGDCNNAQSCRWEAPEKKCMLETPPSSPLDGMCGSVNGKYLVYAPAENLRCFQGNVQGFSGLGPWSRKCGGINGGAMASCSAKLKGSCEATPMVLDCRNGGKKGCETGTVKDCIYDGQNTYKRFCVGPDGTPDSKSYRCTGKDMKLE